MILKHEFILGLAAITVMFILSACSPSSDLSPESSTNIKKPLSDSHSDKVELTKKLESTQLANGGFTPLDHWQGQWRLINIWAEWCKPCWQEIPQLNQFNTEQNTSDIKLLGFNFDELGQAELAFLKQKMQIEFPVLVSWPAHWQKPEIKGLPATVIIAPDDTVKDVLWGEQTVESLQEVVKKLSLP